MRRVPSFVVASSMAALALALPGRAFAQTEPGPARSEPGGANADIEELRRDERFAFCAKPKKPLLFHGRELCSVANEVKGCEGFQQACGEPPPKPEVPSKSTLTEILAMLAKVMVWVLVVAVALAIAFPLVRALLRARRDRALAEPDALPNVASALVEPPAEPELVGDAESALREADALAQRGDLSRALGLYLAASLVALDRRGALRLGKHRTNGEYVRSCAEAPARSALREIVREVDRVEFGKIAPDAEAVTRVRARATAVVRAAAVALTVLVLAGCGLGSSSGPRVDEPAGRELPIELLKRRGYEAGFLPTSLAALPMPGALTATPIVVVDLTRVALEDESEAHLLRWVDEGGVLVLLGPAEQWPRALHASSRATDETTFDVYTDVGVTRGGRAPAPRALSWPTADAFAFTPDARAPVGARLDRGKGAVIGFAASEAFTNIGISVPGNGDAVLALVHVAASERLRHDDERGVLADAARPRVLVAGNSDGIAPPTSPFAALARSGLGKGAWHALAASLLLFLAYGIRQSRARPRAEPVRRAFAEHVEATGAFYGRARAWPHALSAYGRFAELRVRERLPRGADPAAFLAQRAGISEEEASRVWTRATAAKPDDVPVGDEAKAIRDLRSLLSRALG